MNATTRTVPTDLKELAAECRAARRDLNLTQQELATQAGVSVGTIKNLESGELRTQAGTFAKIAAVLNIEARRAETFSPWERQAAAAVVHMLRKLPAETRDEALHSALEAIGRAHIDYALQQASSLHESRP